MLAVANGKMIASKWYLFYIRKIVTMHFDKHSFVMLVKELPVFIRIISMNIFSLTGCHTRSDIFFVFIHCVEVVL